MSRPAPETEAHDRERSVPAEPGREGEFANVIPRAQRDRNVRDGFHPVGFRPGVLGSRIIRYYDPREVANCKYFSTT